VIWGGRNKVGWYENDGSTPDAMFSGKQYTIATCNGMGARAFGVGDIDVRAPSWREMTSSALPMQR
jgi:hypothetical protein